MVRIPRVLKGPYSPEEPQESEGPSVRKASSSPQVAISLQTFSVFLPKPYTRQFGKAASTLRFTTPFLRPTTHFFTTFLGFQLSNVAQILTISEIPQIPQISKIHEISKILQKCLFRSATNFFRSTTNFFRLPRTFLGPPRTFLGIWGFWSFFRDLGIMGGGI